MSIAVHGEALIDLVVGDDDAYRPHLGGSPYNVAIGLARQGIDVTYLSSLSNDSFGDQLYASLVNEGVHVPLQRRSLWPTSLALVTLGNRGQPKYQLYREGIADKDTSFEEIVTNLPKDLRVFHTGSLAITPSQLPKIRKVFDLMREQGILVSVDINIRLGASIDTLKYLEGIRSLFGMADIVKASAEDLDAFEFDSDIRTTAEIVYRDVHPGILVLTQGADGALLLNEHGTFGHPAYPLASLVDTIGAGDTFHAAFLAFLYRGGELSKSPDNFDKATLSGALEFACAAAAINASRTGCSPPTQAEVSEFITAAGAPRNSLV